MQRIELESAYVLHVKPYRETSIIVYALTENYGVIHLLTRGVRSKGRGLLQPFSLLQISWSGRGELYTMSKYEYLSVFSFAEFRQQMSALYVNELLLRMVPVGSPSTELFNLYSKTLTDLSSGDKLAPVLRLFEFQLLNFLGHPLQLDYDVITEEPIDEEHYYIYEPNDGPIKAAHLATGWNYVAGKVLKSIREGMFVDENGDIRKFLGGMIQYHLNGKTIKCRDIIGLI